MWFGLKNAGATYQRAMIAIFDDMVHDCLKDYIGDIVLKFKEVYHNIDNLRKVFTRCMQYS